MAIICRSADGWLLDHKRFIDDIYAYCDDLTAPNSKEPSVTQCILETVKGDNETKNHSEDGTPDIHEEPQGSTQIRHVHPPGYALKETLFDIHDPFRMDSWFEKHSQTNEKPMEELHDGSDNQLNKHKRRKRKRPVVETNEGLEAAQAYHMQVKDPIVRATDKLRSLGRERNLFNVECHKASTNNKEARALARCIETQGQGFADFCYMVKDFTSVDGPAIDLDLTGAGDCGMTSVYNVMVRHGGRRAALRRLVGEMYLVPPQAAFLMSDISNMAPLTAEGELYDLIVMDPPWTNKSVKRKRTYRELSTSDLLDLPVLAAPGALLAVWTTNRAAHHHFVRDRLLPHWGARPCATWTWVKVTQKGDFVTDMESPHGKRCYETLILGRVPEVGGDVDMTSQRTAVPDHQVLVSVPCSLHSSKPPLHDVLAPYIAPSPRRLELFARNLLPGWMSWGNEVLKLQQVTCFTQKELPS